MGFAALFIEVKGRPAADPFLDPPDGVDPGKWQFVLRVEGRSVRDRNEMKKAFGQNITYAAEIMARQHRQALYSITLSGSMARFIRWDRAGALVTAAFDIRKSPELLCDFLWCFSLTTEARRGYDLTVEAANAIERGIFLKAIKKQILTEANVGFNASSASAIDDACSIHHLLGHVTVVRVSEDDFARPRRYLVSRPLVYPSSPFGHGTRLYWAVDITGDPTDEPYRVVLLKDTWRADPPSSGRTEGETLRHLRASGLTEHLPKVLYDSDVIMRDAVPQPVSDKKVRITMQEFCT